MSSRSSSAPTAAVAPTRSRKIALWLGCLIALLVLPARTLACACGCGIFDVGAGTMIPSDSESGLSVWFRYSYMNQNQNWAHGSKAPASDNDDKAIETSFFTPGISYVINHSWSLMAELPIYSRSLTTTDDGTVNGPAGSIYTAHLTDMGDLLASVMFHGFSPDMSTGLQLGLKLPTGNYTGPNGSLGGSEIDRDTLPGTGSTDVVVGGYHFGGLNSDNSLLYFAQARFQGAFLTRNDYRPGNELDAALGLSYSIPLGAKARLTPIVQALGSYRIHDTGGNSDPLNSGYERLFVAPGVEVRVDKVKLYADVEVPVYQYTRAADPSQGTSGQLVAPYLLKVQLTYGF
ncbi:MAG TPA: hypothetical protein VLV16_02100 [Gemmatimonadales bacterium]|nr:hypothetical protein [Gemmatimonadales bacterium]